VTLELSAGGRFNKEIREKAVKEHLSTEALTK
jgi:hypothetical protein